MTLRVSTVRPFVVMGIAALVIVAVRVAWQHAGLRLLINTTASEPYGVYRLRPLEDLRRGQLVVLAVPRAYASLVVARGWLPAGWPLLKGIGALPGDAVCVTDEAVTVNGEPYGPVYAQDSEGRPMPRVRGCQTVADGSFWPLSRYTNKSFDGRYVGPQPQASIVGEAQPLWTF